MLQVWADAWGPGMEPHSSLASDAGHKLHCPLALNHGPAPSTPSRQSLSSLLS